MVLNPEQVFALEPILLFIGILVVAIFFPRRRRWKRKKIWIDPQPLAHRLERRQRTHQDLSPEITIVRDTVFQGRCWVIDGDTIDIGGTRIRLAGIDAPELDHPYGQRAKFALMRLCKGQVVRAVTEGDQSHDRWIATCTLPDGRDLSAEMVREGHAIDWPKFSKGKYRHLEPEGIRKRLWRCDARQKGRMPPSLPD
ncbi:MAG: thermonuclease family protein [Paracoccaceae bacterium]